jgi:hypothetical protein
MSSIRSLLTWERRRFGKDLAHLEAGLEATEPAQGNRKYRERV